MRSTIKQPFYVNTRSVPNSFEYESSLYAVCSSLITLSSSKSICDKYGIRALSKIKWISSMRLLNWV